jgi:hypothetical protein
MDSVAINNIRMGITNRGEWVGGRQTGRHAERERGRQPDRKAERQARRREHKRADRHSCSDRQTASQTDSKSDMVGLWDAAVLLPQGTQTTG